MAVVLSTVYTAVTCHNIKFITSTIWATEMLVLLMAEVYEVATDGMMYSYVSVLIETRLGIQVILRPTPQQFEILQYFYY
jgi:hypothetical protein